MLVVIDANVFVSAAIQRGASYRIINRWLSGSAEFEVVMCPQLLDEIRQVLTNRSRLRKWINLDDAVAFADTIEALIDLVPNPADFGAETRDPNDDYIVALARTRGAEAIVSGDKDLLEWETQDPKVMTPTQFERVWSDPH